MGKALKRPEVAYGKMELDGLCGPSAHFQKRIESEALSEGLSPLTRDHWAVMQFVLDSYLSCGQVPVAVKIGRATGLSPRQLSALFPAGAVKTVLRLAGMELPPDLPMSRVQRTLN